MKDYDYYTLKATIKHSDGRVVDYYYSKTLKEFNYFYDKVLKPQGDEVIKLENIKKRRKYYS